MYKDDQSETLRSVDKEEFLSRMKEFYIELIVYIVAFVLGAFGFPTWAPILAWGILLFGKAEKLGLFEGVWKSYVNSWYRRKPQGAVKEDRKQSDIKADEYGDK
ncbi:hypothetical protein [Candidatus Hydrogenosomobacter endosymbioticus]|uniref:Transmembrane protein n=1 Tax=Candidatus Hydrogenosomobacter endosymbioticus TaxID=2558174 RepID=A0ABM7V9E0_9PROT|nr:hypothetical protein [Candidatus Hydrogenosomobacter endosymbioticus]BDB96415.1 hypothetical protein HYD_5480 [Candidatus Hydrogenosomobacter endosymbioticus]